MIAWRSHGSIEPAAPLTELGAGDAQPVHGFSDRHLGVGVPLGAPSGPSGLPNRFSLRTRSSVTGDDLVLRARRALRPLPRPAAPARGAIQPACGTLQTPPSRARRGASATRRRRLAAARLSQTSDTGTLLEVVSAQHVDCLVGGVVGASNPNPRQPSPRQWIAKKTFPSR